MQGRLGSVVSSSVTILSAKTLGRGNHSRWKEQWILETVNSLYLNGYWTLLGHPICFRHCARHYNGYKENSYFSRGSQYYVCEKAGIQCNTK